MIHDLRQIRIVPGCVFSIRKVDGGRGTLSNGVRKKGRERRLSVSDSGISALCGHQASGLAPTPAPRCAATRWPLLLISSPASLLVTFDHAMHTSAFHACLLTKIVKWRLGKVKIWGATASKKSEGLAEKASSIRAPPACRKAQSIRSLEQE